MPKAIGLFGDAQPHARWLHELRNVVSTASVATAMGRRLLRDDARSAEDVLVEAEQALSQCRDLLAAAGDHVREDAGDEDVHVIRVARMTPALPRAPGRDSGGTGRRRGDGMSRALR